MRPKRKILLIDSNEVRQSIIRFALVQLSFEVFSYANVKAAKQRLSKPDLVDAVLAYWPVEEGKLSDSAHKARVPSLLVIEGDAVGVECLCDSTLRKPSNAMVFDALRTMCAKRRGPRPVKKPPVGIAAVTMEVAA